MPGISDFRQFIYDVFENQSRSIAGMLIEKFLLMLIFTNVFFAMLETVGHIGKAYYSYFWWFEALSITIFSIEYLARLWVSDLRPDFQRPWGRLRFAFSIPMLFDLIAIMPFFLQVLFPIPPYNLRFLRVVRISRIMRIAPYSIAFDRIIAVIRRERDELFAVVEIMMICLVISSSFVYLAEMNVPDTKFTSIPATLWWGIATVTTLGYGDMVPVTVLGKIFGGIAAVFGIGLFALPTGLLGASFYREVTDRREKNIREMRHELESIASFTEESGEKLDQFLGRQQRRILKLEKELKSARNSNKRYQEKLNALKK